MTAPIVREVIVAVDPARAFAAFTAEIGSWWPLARFGMLHDGSVAFEGDTLVERSGDASSLWGTVVEWDAPSALAFTWHPGSDAADATHVRVTFTPHVDGTLVTLTHSGWERSTEVLAERPEYESGWPGVLALYAAHAGA